MRRPRRPRYNPLAMVNDRLKANYERKMKEYENKIIAWNYQQQMKNANR